MLVYKYLVLYEHAQQKSTRRLTSKFIHSQNRVTQKTVHTCDLLAESPRTTVGTIVGSNLVPRPSSVAMAFASHVRDNISDSSSRNQAWAEI